MRKEDKWWAAASCGYRQCGKSGLSAGMLMMTKRNRDVILPNIDDEGITGDPRMISAILRGDTEVILQHVYGHVGVGLVGGNYEMIRDIGAATDGGRRFVIAMGDYNIKPEILEASGLLEAFGLTLIRPDNVDITCTSGEGAMLDYALATTNFVSAVVSLKADTTIPWGPHYGLRIRFKTDTSAIRIPEIVRPVVFDKAVEQLEKKGLRYQEGVAGDDLPWEQARRMTQQMVDNSLRHPNLCCEEYVQRLGIQKQVQEATREYAEWSAAAEMRMFAKARIKVHEMSEKDI